MKVKYILFLIVLFFTINVSVYLLTKLSIDNKMEIILQDSLKTLEMHYHVLLESQKSSAQTIYELSVNIDGFTEIISQANNATQERKTQLREELSQLITPLYKAIQQKGILQYQVVLSNNESFYRAHKPDKFGDYLGETRSDFKYTNITKKPIRGFTQGKTAHGFRNTFPIFDKQNEYIGAIEISFASEKLQWYLNNISGIHTHFIVDKDIFQAKAWQRDDLVLEYEESSESSKYMITLSTIHTREKCIVQNKIKLDPAREEIDKKIEIGDAFSLYVKFEEHREIVAFLPIKNLENKTVAWLVSYSKNTIIEKTIFTDTIVRLVSLLISILIIYFLIKQILSKEELQKQHKIVNEILSATDNSIIITDFNDIKYANDKFKSMMHIQDLESFNVLNSHNMLNIFNKTEGFLHMGLLQEDESFISLLLKTSPEDRIVSILDKNFELKSYKISLTKLESKSDYLVTLSDITKMKEQRDEMQVKVYKDGLTKVYNRNKFDEVFLDELQRSKRYDTSFSIAILDIDKFKNFNDTYGHLIGDEVLISMAQTVNKNVRETDFFARWGGEEFVILFKNTSVEEAKEVSEKLKDKIEHTIHPIAGNITVSFGLSEYIKGDTMESIFKRCDAALYKAKENGRNRIETS